VESPKNVSTSPKPEVIEKKKENRIEYDVQFSEKVDKDKIKITCTAKSKEYDSEDRLIKEMKIDPKQLTISPKEIYFWEFIDYQGQVSSQKVACEYNTIVLSEKEIELKTYKKNPFVINELKKIQKQIIERIISNLYGAKDQYRKSLFNRNGAFLNLFLIEFVKLDKEYLLPSSNKHCANYLEKAERLNSNGLIYKITELIDIAELCKEKMK
jgi:hypothetical protein